MLSPSVTLKPITAQRMACKGLRKWGITPSISVSVARSDARHQIISVPLLRAAASLSPPEMRRAWGVSSENLGKIRSQR